jgi:hypothetical protein
VDLEVTAKCIGPVFKPDQAGALAEVRPAAPVVVDAQVQGVVAGGDLDVRGGGARVLGGVGQGLRDGVVGGGLDRFGQPLVYVDIEADRDGGPAG